MMYTAFFNLLIFAVEIKHILIDNNKRFYLVLASGIHLIILLDLQYFQVPLAPFMFSV